MTTRLYLPWSAALGPDARPAYAAEWEDTSQAERMPTKTTKLGQAIATKTISTPASASVPYDVLVGQWVSPPLDSNQTITGTVKGQIRVHESNAGADLRAQMVIRVVSNDGSTVRGTLLAADTGSLISEFSTSLTNRKFPVGARSNTLSSVSALTGDRIVIEVGARQHTSGVARSSQWSFGDSSATDLAEDETTTTANNPWIELSQTLTFAGENDLHVTSEYFEVATTGDSQLRVTSEYFEVAVSVDRSPMPYRNPMPPLIAQ